LLCTEGVRVLRRNERVDVDYLILGHGAAGLFCAALLASRGARVAVAGAGETATSLSTGCIGILGRREVSSGPIGELSIHFPYSIDVGESPEVVFSRLFGFLLPRLEAQGVTMMGDPGQRRLFLSRLGTAHSSSFVQEFCLPESEGEVALLGLMGYQDLDPDLAVRVMRERNSSLQARAFWMRPECFGDRTDLNCQEVARMVEIGLLLEELTEAMADLPQESVGIPPIADLGFHHRAMRELREVGGREVMELVTPMGLPGRRLQEAMKNMCLAEDVRLLLSHSAIAISMEGEEASEVLLRTKSREIPVSFSGLVLATGDLVGGGIDVRGRELIDPLSSFQVMPKGGGDLRTAALSGYMTEDLHPVSKKGAVVRNVVVAGSCLSGFSYPFGVGIGGALYTSWLAADELGGW
jgi:anaerobic glycerol-3-phosphate dehydrogenase